MLHRAPLKSPQDVAAFLASYARAARLQLEGAPLESLAPLKSNLENALGIEFKAVDKPNAKKKLSEIEKQQRGDHFFRATLVQTLFYGLFSAWLSHITEAPDELFRWREAQYSLHVPMVSKLFEQLVSKSTLHTLDLQALLELATDTLNRVEVKPFLSKWGEAQAVQYFYEPFLEAFDAGLRKDLGVYYTPPEIVQYMVERVHRVLKTELNIEAGLADEKVIVLDPCCGTGAFILETLRVIGRELKDSKPSNQVAGLLKDAALERVFGFEILPAPFVVAHHGVADLLRANEVEMKEDERAPIYLTNALTGWDALPKTDSMFAEFKDESELATGVKQQQKIWVIIGNPPYDAFAKMEKDETLVAPYKENLFSKWGISKNSLDDLYVRFFRVAERKLNGSDQGLLCFISNFSWTFDASFVGMRSNLLDSFDEFWIDNLNGDSRETGKRTPEGTPDPSIFSTSFNREGIRKGVSIGLAVRGKETSKQVLYRELWGQSKREELVESLENADFNGQYTPVEPSETNKFRLRSRSVNEEYTLWPEVIEFAASDSRGAKYVYNGPYEARGNSLIVHQTEKEQLQTLQNYLDETVTNEAIAQLQPRWIESAGEFNGVDTRESLKGKVKWSESTITPYFFKPFDVRLAYLDADIAPLFSRPSPFLLKSRDIPNNAFFITRAEGKKQFEGAPMLFSSVVCDRDSISGHARHFPMFIAQKLEKKSNKTNLALDFVEEKIIANLSERARLYLSELDFGSPDDDAQTASLLWHHALAIGYALSYRVQHEGGLANDWPRVPLPADAENLRVSARLGARVAALLDVATPVDGIESGKFNFDLEPFGEITHRLGKTIEEGDACLKVTHNWGFFQDAKVQAGDGTIKTRVPDNREADALEKMGCARDTPVCDIWASEDLSWSGVPKPVWDTIIGGYLVIKKWLSYRDHRVLGRALHLSEAREIENMVRRLTCLWALENTLNASYESCAANIWEWRQIAEEEEADG